jgi:hypothetical protein
MFDDRGDGLLIDAIGHASRAEASAAARRLTAIGELFARRAAQWAERTMWCADPFEAVAAEVSAALNISRHRAGNQIHYARELRERLPRVAAVFAAGDIDMRMVSTIINRTSTVTDGSIAAVDSALAAVIGRWMTLSGPKLADRIDSCIAKFDPDGVRVPPTIDEQRYVEVEATTPGMAGIWANIHATDAAAFDQRLDALASTVCDNDPRTAAQRRADAVGALAAGADRLMCTCGAADCPALAGAGAAPVVIHVVAEESTVRSGGSTPGYLPGFGIQPAESVRRAAATARLVPLRAPGGDACAGYRPPPALTDFVRYRDLTCRWPGCDARVCDVDHTVPYPRGRTHPSNTKLYCRVHHLIKTFYCGPDGWSDEQLPDGTVIFTAPTGHRYSTEPAGAALFPALAVPTGPADRPAANGPPEPCRGMAMPTRQRTRDRDRSARRQRERQLRARINAEGALAEAVRIEMAEAASPPPF